MKIMIPSYKRAGRVKTHTALGGGSICVHEFEADDYRSFEGKETEIIVIPDKLKGNIAKVRNWILDNAGDEEIVMCDDDIESIGYFEEMEQKELSPEKVQAFLENGFAMCRELGTTLWGINLQSDPKFYREYTPFSLLSPILGTFSCHLKPTLRYDEELFLNEDYDFFLKTIVAERRVLRFNKYFYKADHLNLSGKCAAYRLKEREIEQSKKMIKRWGQNVVSFDIERSTNPRLSVPISGT